MLSKKSSSVLEHPHPVPPQKHPPRLVFALVFCLNELDLDTSIVPDWISTMTRSKIMLSSSANVNVPIFAILKV